MKACGRCGAWIPDEAKFCPSCGGAAASPGPDAASAPGPGPSGGPAGAEGPPPPPRWNREKAAARVRTLGTLYTVTGALVLAWVAFSFFQAATGATLESLEKLERDIDPSLRDSVRVVKGLQMLPWFLAVSHVVPFALGVVCLWSGTSLRALQGGTLGLVASVLLIVLGPCSNCCCCLTIPLGIWGLVVLTRADTELLLSGAT